MKFRKSIHLWCLFSFAAMPLAHADSYSIAVAPGWSMIANQLDHGSNTLNEVFPTVPDDSIVFKYNNAEGTWVSSVYTAATGGWSPADVTLNPGEGFFINFPGCSNLTFSGSLRVPVLPINIPAGRTYLVSRQVPSEGTYANIIGLPPVDFSKMYRFNGANYNVYTWVFGSWNIDPLIATGESVWIESPSGGPLPPLPPLTILHQPAGTTVGCGGSVSLSVLAAFNPSYQWRKNGTNLVQGSGISGVTANRLVFDPVTFDDAGSYTVVLTESSQCITSSVATLTVVQAPVFQSPFLTTNAQVVLSWTGAGENYQLQYRTNLSQTNWIDVGTPLVTSNTAVYVTNSVGADSNRFYRLIQQ